MFLEIFFCPWKHKKLPSKVAYFTSHSQIFSTAKQPKTSPNILFHKKGLPRDLYIITLAETLSTNFAFSNRIEFLTVDQSIFLNKILQFQRFYLFFQCSSVCGCTLFFFCLFWNGCGLITSNLYEPLFGIWYNWKISKLVTGYLIIHWFFDQSIF